MYILQIDQLNSDIDIKSFNDIFTGIDTFYSNGGFEIKVKKCSIISFHIGCGETVISAGNWFQIGTISTKPIGNIYGSCTISSGGVCKGSFPAKIDSDGKMYVNINDPLNYAIIDGIIISYNV